MRAPKSRRSLNGPSSSFVAIISSIILSIFLLGPIPASTRSVASARRHDIRESSIDRIIDEKSTFNSQQIPSGSLSPGRNEEKLEDHVSTLSVAGASQPNIRELSNDRIIDEKSTSNSQQVPSGSLSRGRNEEKLEDHVSRLSVAGASQPNIRESSIDRIIDEKSTSNSQQVPSGSLSRGRNEEKLEDHVSTLSVAGASQPNIRESSIDRIIDEKSTSNSQQVPSGSLGRGRNEEKLKDHVNTLNVADARRHDIQESSIDRIIDAKSTSNSQQVRGGSLSSERNEEKLEDHVSTLSVASARQPNIRESSIDRIIDEKSTSNSQQVPSGSLSRGRNEEKLEDHVNTLNVADARRHDIQESSIDRIIDEKSTSNSQQVRGGSLSSERNEEKLEDHVSTLSVASARQPNIPESLIDRIIDEKSTSNSQQVPSGSLGRGRNEEKLEDHVSRLSVAGARQPNIRELSIDRIIDDKSTFNSQQVPSGSLSRGRNEEKLEDHVSRLSVASASQPNIRESSIDRIIDEKSTSNSQQVRGGSLSSGRNEEKLEDHVSTLSVASARQPNIPESSIDRITDEKSTSNSQQVPSGSLSPGRNEEESEDHSAASHRVSRRSNTEKPSTVDDKKLSSRIETRLRKKDEETEGPKDASGKSSLTSEFGRAKAVEVSAKEENEGIRRFDAIVASDDTIGKASAVENEGPQDRSGAGSGIGKTVTKGIIVRDAPVDAGTAKEAYLSRGLVDRSKLGQHRRRSLNDAESAEVRAESTKEKPTKESHEPSSERAESDFSSQADRDESTVDSIESLRVPVLVPVASSHAKPLHKLSKHVVPETREHGDNSSSAVEESSRRAEIEKGSAEIDGEVKRIPESIRARGSTVGELGADDKSAVVVPETKKIVLRPNGLGDVAKRSDEGSSQAEQSGEPMPSAAEHDENDEEEEEDDGSKLKIDVGKRSEEEIPKPPKNQDSLDYASSSLLRIIKTNVSLEGLKLQAISLQEDIKNKNLLQRLKDQAVQVLPGIPKFDEHELLGALKLISSSKKAETGLAGYSYLSKIDAGLLSESQLKILRCAEALVLRERRQSFAENVLECIRGMNILNCMRIFVWPIIADNIPESVSQYLPTLPIEVSVMDLLPGGRRDEPKSTRSSPAASPDQRRLLTPELVVSGILKDALTASPSSGEIATTVVDPHSETLSKLLTPGQLEILKMAEKFIPESARREYSNRMYSCVRRFEYFSCVKYFAWPMVKQHFSSLPEFPDYQSWYPSATLHPGYPVLPFPSTEGIGELPEVVEADATRTRRPRPEAVIVNILESALRRAPNTPVAYQAGLPEVASAPVTAAQMAIFYTAEQLIPAAIRPEFMSKTIRCVRDYDYLTCTKYSTWPTVRQFFPALPSFPDFSSWIPTFAVPELPDFSQYIPDFGSYFPALPGFPGSSPTPAPTVAPTAAPQPIPDKPPSAADNNSGDSPTLSKEEHRPAEAVNAVESRLIHILYNVRWTVLARNPQALPPLIRGDSAVLETLTYSQIQILGLATSVVPHQARGDLDARFVGCLQGGSDFLSCARNVVWPTLQLYVKDLPIFPEEETRPASRKSPEAIGSSGPTRPGTYRPMVDPPGQDGSPFFDNVAAQLEGRSPIGSRIVAEPEASPIPVDRIEPEARITEGIRESQKAIGSLDRTGFAASRDSSAPVISVTDTRFTPIFSDNPESVLLKIISTVQSSSKHSVETSPAIATPDYLESPNARLSADQKTIIQASERLLPDGARSKYTEMMSGCLRTSSFIACSRDVVWPTLSRYYPRLPSFPNFNIDESVGVLPSGSLEPTKFAGPPSGGAVAAISETDVKTGQHGDALVTITDTRFVPIFSQRPEAAILGILRNLQASTGTPSVEQSSTKVAASFTDRQADIVIVSESLLPESIRDVFTGRMIECAKENSFLACTRDIAWPTIAQFFPRLPNFPNVGALPEVAIEGSPQPTLLPPELEPGLELAGPARTPIPAEGPDGLAPPGPSLLPVTPEDADSTIEAALRQISSAGLYPMPESSYLDARDPPSVSFLTDRQANVIRITESMLPSATKPLFVGLMLDCSRENVFPTCARNVAWPMLRQFVPGVPNFPDLSNFGSYFPQIPQEIPQIPQFPDYQAQFPQIPNFPGFQLPGQGFGYPFRGAEDEVAREGSIPGGDRLAGQPGGLYVPGIPGVAPSVDSYRRIFDRGSPSDSAVVWGLSGSAGSSGRRRERRSLATVPTEGHRDVPSETADRLEFNAPESDFLRILVNATRETNEESRCPGVSFLDELDSTAKKALTADRYAILKIVEDASCRTGEAGFVSRVVQCIASLSFARCMGIFVWPVIKQNFPSLLGIPTVGNVDPFGRSRENDSFADIFGMTRTEFERELVARRKNAEGILVDWYRGVVEERYDSDYGFVRVRGYGDGEIGISFNGFVREGRLTKVKDHKNLPSILTILSDIMEDVLDQRESRPDNARRREHGKRDKAKRDRSLGVRVLDDYNKVTDEPDNHTDSKRSSNDDEIIAMFLDKVRSNATSDSAGSGEADRYLSAEKAHEAFELLFGTRLSERVAERLDGLGDSHGGLFGDENSRGTAGGEAGDRGESSAIPMVTRAAEPTDGARGIDGKLHPHLGSDEDGEKKKIRSGLVIRLPKIDEELVSRKITGDLINLGRNMQTKMSQILPGLTFAVSFVIQMALAHARAAASIAEMMSRMALGSAVLSMLRQSVFGSATHPKINYVYDNEAVGHGISWPHHDHHD